MKSHSIKKGCEQDVLYRLVFFPGKSWAGLTCGSYWTWASEAETFCLSQSRQLPCSQFQNTVTVRNTKCYFAAVIWSLHVRMLCRFTNLAHVKRCIWPRWVVRWVSCLVICLTADWVIGGNTEITATLLSSKRPQRRFWAGYGGVRITSVEWNWRSSV